MGDQSHIEWTDATWNPVSGCRKVSEGCRNCYAVRDAHRLAGNPNPRVAAPYTAVTAMINGRLNWTGVFHELPERLDQPLRWTKPRRIFVNSMSDLFGEGISEPFIWRVFLTMAQARQHQFQVLTKRPERMRAILNAPEIQAYVESFLTWRRSPWPLENVWLGTSVEDQKAADARIPALLDTPAAVRFLSCEPLLGPIDLCRVGPRPDSHHDYRTGEHLTAREKDRTTRLDWVIVGGESGPHARPCDLRWIRFLHRQCAESQIPLFVKQLGSLAHDSTAAWLALGQHEPEGEQWRTGRLALRHPKGGDPEEWPAALRIRQFPETTP